MRRSRRRWRAAGVLTCGAVVAALVGSGGPGSGPRDSAAAPVDPSVQAFEDPAGRPAVQGGRAYRAFSPDSWWNTEVPADAPGHPDEAAILDHMRSARQSDGGCLSLAGAENSWGQPVYWAGRGDPEHDIDVPELDDRPELAALRLPAGAQAADTSDRAMTVFDVERGHVVALTGARFDAERGGWRASGATITYLDSNGLDARLAGSDDARNLGTHRGNNGATMMVRHDEVVAGEVGHVVKVASGPEMSRDAVWPMVASDGGARGPVAPEQGLRFRIKPSVDLASLDLHPEARVIAEGLQRYGFYLGDSAGRTALKLENTTAQRQGHKWTVPADGLCGLPLGPELWDVLPAGYDPSG